MPWRSRNPSCPSAAATSWPLPKPVQSALRRDISTSLRRLSAASCILLEHQLGTPLFDRSGRQLLLSTAGETLLKGLRAAAHQHDETLDAISALQGLRRGHLNVATVESISVTMSAGGALPDSRPPIRASKCPFRSPALMPSPNWYASMPPISASPSIQPAWISSMLFTRATIASVSSWHQAIAWLNTPNRCRWPIARANALHGRREASVCAPCSIARLVEEKPLCTRPSSATPCA